MSSSDARLRNRLDQMMEGRVTGAGRRPFGGTRVHGVPVARAEPWSRPAFARTVDGPKRSSWAQHLLERPRAERPSDVDCGCGCGCGCGGGGPESGGCGKGAAAPDGSSLTGDATPANDFRSFANARGALVPGALDVIVKTLRALAPRAADTFLARSTATAGRLRRLSAGREVLERVGGSWKPSRPPPGPPGGVPGGVTVGGSQLGFSSCHQARIDWEAYLACYQNALTARHNCRCAARYYCQPCNAPLDGNICHADCADCNTDECEQCVNAYDCDGKFAQDVSFCQMAHPDWDKWRACIVKPTECAYPCDRKSGENECLKCCEWYDEGNGNTECADTCCAGYR